MLTGAQLYNAIKGMRDLYKRLQKVQSGQPVREPRNDRERYIKGRFNFIEKVVERRGVSKSNLKVNINCSTFSEPVYIPHNLQWGTLHPSYVGMRQFSNIISFSIHRLSLRWRWCTVLCRLDSCNEKKKL